MPLYSSAKVSILLYENLSIYLYQKMTVQSYSLHGQELPGEIAQVSGVDGQVCFGKFPEELEQVQFHIHSQICFGILPLLIPFPMGISFGFGPPEHVVGNLTAPDWP